MSASPAVGCFLSDGTAFHGGWADPSQRVGGVARTDEGVIIHEFCGRGNRWSACIGQAFRNAVRICTLGLRHTRFAKTDRIAKTCQGSTIIYRENLFLP